MSQTPTRAAPPAHLAELLSDLERAAGDAGARALKAVLVLSDDPRQPATSAQHTRRIADCCADLTRQFARDATQNG